MRGLAVAAVLVLVFASGCRDAEVRRTSPGDTAYRQGQLQARLICTEPTWPEGKPLILLFTIINGTDSAARLDARMPRANQIHVKARLPNAKEVMVDRVLFEMAEPKADDIVTLEPRKIYGTVIRIDTASKSLVDALRKPHAGRYVFWADYYGPSSPDVGLPARRLTSNECTVTVP